VRPSAWQLVVIVVIIVVLVGYKRLPDMARSVGRSLRIFKSEVEQLADKDDDPNSTHVEPRDRDQDRYRDIDRDQDRYRDREQVRYREQDGDREQDRDRDRPRRTDSSQSRLDAGFERPEDDTEPRRG